MTKQIKDILRCYAMVFPIASKPRLNHVYHVKPAPYTLAAFAQSVPDENGRTTDYLYQMDEVWPDDEKERNKIIRRRHLDCLVH